MKLSNILSAFVGASILLFTISTQAAIVEVGDLNIISDAGNPSDGLRYLDMTYSDGQTQASALANAQSTYPDARLATPSEFDDLFAAVGALTTTDLVSSGFESGGQLVVATDTSLIQSILGLTTGGAPGETQIWTDPDGSRATDSSRDLLIIRADQALVIQTPLIPANEAVGFLIVSEVPVPAAGWLFMSALVGLIGKKRLSRQ